LIAVSLSRYRGLWIWRTLIWEKIQKNEEKGVVLGGAALLRG